LHDSLNIKPHKYNSNLMEPLFLFIHITHSFTFTYDHFQGYINHIFNLKYHCCLYLYYNIEITKSMLKQG